MKRNYQSGAQKRQLKRRKIAEAARNSQRLIKIEEDLHEYLLEKTNFWKNVLERLVNVTLMLAKYNLPFCGSSEELSKDNKGNFLSVIQLLAKYDTVLDKLLQLPKGFPKCLSYMFPKCFDIK